MRKSWPDYLINDVYSFRSPFIQLQKSINDFLATVTGAKRNSSALLAHCRRELFQGGWYQILEDEEFLKAYVCGIVIKCSDGITRRIFPRIFCYSADYPEK